MDLDTFIVGRLVLWAWSRPADIPGVQRVEILADAGHLLMEDQPERVTETLTRFLTGPVPTPDPVQLDSARP